MLHHSQLSRLVVGRGRSHLLRFVAAIVTSLLASTSVWADPPTFELRDGDRIAFLGGAFVERWQNDGYFETCLTTAHPDKNLTFRNLGWSGDTVWGDSRGVFGSRAEGFKRLVDDTLAAKPTVLAIAYGQNEAFAGEAGVAEFQDGLRKLLDALAPSQARVVLIAPPQARQVAPQLPPVESYNAKLQRYRDAIEQVARERQIGFIDWFALQPSPADLQSLPPLSENGWHLTEAGHWALAPAMARAFGGGEGQAALQIDAKSGQSIAEHCRVSDVKADRDRVSFVLTPASLPYPLLDLKNAEANRAKGIWKARPYATLRVGGLPSGLYRVKTNGVEQVAATHEALANGVTLTTSPQLGQVAQLRAVIHGKNVLFFHRYRPQNETYLFLFRKHEQGNNAVEIPQFDPLIAEKERQIAELRQPKALHFEIAP